MFGFAMLENTVSHLAVTFKLILFAASFQLYYKPEVVDRLEELHKMLINPPSMDGEEDENAFMDGEQATPTWNLNITEFKRVSSIATLEK